ncbi:MAG: polysaccharide deacetylase family protein [Actinobacteria bacterium]|nr:polysaccharide deacetylase family protein [Actinomycetota bacterium]
MVKRFLSAEKYYLFILIFQIVMMVFFYRHYPYNQILVNNKEVFIPNGITIKNLAEQINFNLSRGDLLDTEGNLVKKRRGFAPKIIVNGEPASFKSKVYLGDEVFLKKGNPKIEEIIKQEGVVSKEINVSGRGAFLVFTSSGEDGKKLIFRGKESLKIVEEKTIKQSTTAFVKRTDSRENGVALTFDDGPGRYTIEVVSILKQYNVPATFFVIGKAVRRHQDIARQIVSLGFTIGNHTYSHAKLTETDALSIIDELEKTEDIVIRATGIKPKWFRPPELQINSDVVKISSALNYQIVLAAVDPSDYKKTTPSAIVNRIIKNVRPGAVIVLHDGGGNQKSTVSALPLIINSLRSRGFQFVSLDQLFEKL